MNKRQVLLRLGPFRHCQARVAACLESRRLGPARGPVGVLRSARLLPGCPPLGCLSLFLPFVPARRRDSRQSRKSAGDRQKEDTHPTCLLWRATAGPHTSLSIPLRTVVSAIVFFPSFLFFLGPLTCQEQDPSFFGDLKWAP